ncbi:MAG: aminocarboxymuconate-semialdehyde decarboxylase [Pseudonocardia sp. SCN 72-86]|nr:MAG: aminocarboxymuconate-semialdehyde decarboxylase [Pseudonocardia sp. SCN 72-86]
MAAPDVDGRDIPDGRIDVHTHAIAPQLEPPAPGRWPTVERTAPDRARIMLGGSVYREVDDRCWSAERRVADMDADGVAVQLVSPIPVTLSHDKPAEPAAALCRLQNEFLADLCGQAPDRLRALGAVPLQDVEAAVAELRRCVVDMGFAGVEIGTVVGDTELADPVLDPFFDEAAALGAFVLVHPVDQTLDPRAIGLGLAFGLGMPSETAIAGAGLVSRPLRRPGVTLCLAHGGGALPQILPRLDRGASLDHPGEPLPTERARELWCDSLTYDADSLALSVRRFGADHVMCGTDYPFVVRESPAGAVLDDVDPDLAAAIGRANALAALARVSSAPRR